MCDDSNFMVKEACALYGTKEVAKQLSVQSRSVDHFLAGNKQPSSLQQKRLQGMLNLYPVKRNKRGGMKLLSFFAGAGGLDLGFQKAGFNVLWANE